MLYQFRSENRTLLLLPMTALGWCEILHLYRLVPLLVTRWSRAGEPWWGVTQPMYFSLLSLSSSQSKSCDHSFPWWPEIVVGFRTHRWKQKFKNPSREPESTRNRAQRQLLFLVHTCRGGSAALNNSTPQLGNCRSGSWCLCRTKLRTVILRFRER